MNVAPKAADEACSQLAGRLLAATQRHARGHAVVRTCGAKALSTTCIAATGVLVCHPLRAARSARPRSQVTVEEGWPQSGVGSEVRGLAHDASEGTTVVGHTQSALQQGASAKDVDARRGWQGRAGHLGRAAALPELFVVLHGDRIEPPCTCLGHCAPVPQIAALMQELAFDELDAPVLRVTGGAARGACRAASLIVCASPSQQAPALEGRLAMDTSPAPTSLAGAEVPMPYAANLEVAALPQVGPRVFASAACGRACVPLPCCC
jgi:hypothetical protein